MTNTYTNDSPSPCRGCAKEIYGCSEYKRCAKWQRWFKHQWRGSVNAIRIPCDMPPVEMPPVEDEPEDTVDYYADTELSRRIRELRQQRGISQKELAETCGILAETLSLYEHGHTEPSVRSLAALADVLGTSVSYLITGDDRPYDFPDRLRELRQQRGLSIQTLNDLCGFGHGTVYAYEHGRTSPRYLSNLRKIADVLGVPVADLIGGRT